MFTSINTLVESKDFIIFVIQKTKIEKESKYELQKIDCNCNDCGFLTRDLAKLNAVREHDKKFQLLFFDYRKGRAISEATNLIQRKPEKGQVALKAANNLKHVYAGQSFPLSYGHCNKLLKDVSFIPNLLQLETQECFVHRKDIV